MASKYTKMNSKYLSDGKRLLQQGDYAQASEKYWGAVAQMLKLVAARRGLELGTHQSLSEFVSVLHNEKPELNLSRLYGVVNSLHTNFYEDNLTPQQVRDYAEAAIEIIEKLEQFK